MRTFLFALCLISIVSCKKDESTSSSSCKFETSTFVGKWKITKVLETKSGTDISSAYFVKVPCDKTSIYEFKSNNLISQTGGTDNNGVPCPGGSVSWSLTTVSNVNYMIWSGSQSYTVSSYSCNSLTLVSTDETYILSKQ